MKRTKAIKSLSPTAGAVLAIFIRHPRLEITANSVAVCANLPLGAVTPRLAELDERGYGFIHECRPVVGTRRLQKAWRYRGDDAVLFNVDRDGRVMKKLSYRELWIRERESRSRLVRYINTTRQK